ncbi:MAG TPA: FKBP-type peptidyl-prolyl cis-trans isomerase [Candidatus Elarobacter sp.]|jgi:peptidylprolyl isomerase
MTRCAPLVLALLFAAPLPVVAATTAANTPAPKPKLPIIHTMAPRPIPGKTVTLPDGLKYTDITVGKGATPATGQTAVVHYTGTFPNGKKFDSSRDRGQPFEFVLNAPHSVIACWNEAVASMRVGGRRKLVCPPAVAYGEQGYPPVIPPNATLNFDVELLAVKKT